MRLLLWSYKMADGPQSEIEVTTSKNPLKLSVDAEAAQEFKARAVKSVAHKREDARILLALTIIAPMPAIVLFTFITMWFTDAKYSELRELVETLITPIVGIVGAVTGFYFSESRNWGDDEN